MSNTNDEELMEEFIHSFETNKSIIEKLNIILLHSKKGKNQIIFSNLISTTLKNCLGIFDKDVKQPEHNYVLNILNQLHLLSRSFWCFQKTEEDKNLIPEFLTFRLSECYGVILDGFLKGKKNSKHLEDIIILISRYTSIVAAIMDSEKIYSFELVQSFNMDLFHMYSITYQHKDELKLKSQQSLLLMTKSYVGWMMNVISKITCDADGAVNFFTLISSIFEFLKNFEESMPKSSLDATWRSIKSVLKNEINVKYIQQQIESVHLSNPDEQNVIQEICTYIMEKSLKLLQKSFDSLRIFNFQEFGVNAKLCRFYLIIVKDLLQVYGSSFSDSQSLIIELILSFKFEILTSFSKHPVFDESVVKFTAFTQNILDHFANTISTQQKMNLIRSFMIKNKHTVQEKSARIACISLLINNCVMDKNIQQFIHSEVVPNIFDALETCCSIMLSKTESTIKSEYMNLVLALNKYLTTLNGDDSKIMILKLFEYSFTDLFFKSQISMDLLICNYHSSTIVSRKNFISLVSQMLIVTSGNVYGINKDCSKNPSEKYMEFQMNILVKVKFLISSFLSINEDYSHFTSEIGLKKFNLQQNYLYYSQIIASLPSNVLIHLFSKNEINSMMLIFIQNLQLYIGSYSKSSTNLNGLKSLLQSILNLSTITTIEKENISEITSNLFSILSEKDKVEKSILLISCEILTTICLSQEHFVELFQRFRYLYKSHEYLQTIISNFILNSYKIHFNSKNQNEIQDNLTTLISYQEKEQKNWIQQSENIQNFTNFLKKSGNSMIKNSISDEMKLNASHFNSERPYKEIENQNENVLFDLSFNLSNNKRKREFNEIENETKKIKLPNKNSSTNSLNNKLEEKEILICKMTLTKVLDKLNSLNDLKNLSSSELKNISRLSEEISKKCKF
eukprot:gene1365-11987_t